MGKMECAKMLNTVSVAVVALLLLFLSSISIADADNTPNMCTDDIPNLVKVRPSDTNLDMDVIPNITVGSFEYDGDAEHFVISKNNETVTKVLVYLPGTTDRPELSSCLLKSVSTAIPYPTIGLSYNYLSSGDRFRSGKCKLLYNSSGLEEQINCLEQQHKDAIDGGEYGSTHFEDDDLAFWGPVDPNNSITARLGKLLQYLDKLNPGAGWNNTYYVLVNDTSVVVNDTSMVVNGTSVVVNDTHVVVNDTYTYVRHVVKKVRTPQPKWDRVIVMGHSQGAGHAAYLGQTKKLQGAAMISGPQDECVDCPDNTTFWIDNSVYKTKNLYTAFASSVESLYSVMEDNWRRMRTANATNWGPSIDADFALAIDMSDACTAPIVSHMKPAATSTCGSHIAAHCSTAIDGSVPFLEKTDGEKKYVYEISVWPSIAMVAGCENDL